MCRESGFILVLNGRYRLQQDPKECQARGLVSVREQVESLESVSGGGLPGSNRL